jgi:hypothetical protein
MLLTVVGGGLSPDVNNRAEYLLISQVRRAELYNRCLLFDLKKVSLLILLTILVTWAH